MKIKLGLFAEGPKEPEEIPRLTARLRRTFEIKPAVLDAQIRFSRRLVRLQRFRQQLRKTRKTHRALFFKPGAQDPCKAPHFHRIDEIVLHQSFSRRHVRAVGIAEPRGDFRLHVKGQLFVGAPAQVMEMRPHRPQKPLRLDDGLALSLADDFIRRRLVIQNVAKGVTVNPADGLQIAQPTLAFFYIRLDQIPRFKRFRLSLALFFKLGGDEFRNAPAAKLVVSLVKFVINILGAAQKARIQISGAGDHIALGELHRTRWRMRCISQLHAGIP